MVNRFSPVDKVKNVYWIGHFLFFIIILVVIIISDPKQFSPGKIDGSLLMGFASIWAVGYIFFFIANYVYFKAVNEKFTTPNRVLYQVLYSIVLIIFTLLFFSIYGEKVYVSIYVIPVALIAMTCGPYIGIAATIILGFSIFFLQEYNLSQRFSIHEVTTILCLLILAWLVGQISQISILHTLQLAKEKKFLSGLIETFSGGIIITNLKGEIILCNKEIENIFKINKSNLMGQMETLLWYDCSPPVFQWPQNFNNLEITTGSKSYLVSRFILTGPGPEEICYATVINDITEHKQQQLQLQRLATLSAVGELAAGAAHEIRNPLTTVRGFLQLLREKVTDPRTAELSQLAIEEVDHINNIVTSMLQLAKPENGQIGPLDINQIINETWDLYTYSGIRKGISYEKELAYGLPLLAGNAKQIKQVLLNLLKNAENACNPGDKIKVNTYVDNHVICLSVTDTGKGIVPEQLEKIFNPFYTTSSSGTGLGLAICNRIVADHQGTIKVDSQPGMGTTFTVCFRSIDVYKSNHQQ